MSASVLLKRQLSAAREIIPGKLAFAMLSIQPVDTKSTHFFSIDNFLLYNPFFADFGPLNMGHTYRFCKALNAKLETQEVQSGQKKIVYYCSFKPPMRSNAAVLVCAFQIIYMNRTAEEAYNVVKPFAPFLPFRDAGVCISTFNLTVEHMAQAIYQGHVRKWMDFETFNVEEYEYYEMVESGDLNIIIPGLFLAFASPYGLCTGRSLFLFMLF